MKLPFCVLDQIINRVIALSAAIQPEPNWALTTTASNRAPNVHDTILPDLHGPASGASAASTGELH